MGMTDEVLKTYTMVKNAGFEVEDVIFEGAMRVKGKELLQHIEELASKKKAVGTIKIAYSAGENQARTIEIPVGEPFPEVSETEEAEA
ncbi:hypothetical protein HY546_02335 [archaeon]|nr:hypothetical protein [archaeon]